MEGDKGETGRRGGSLSGRHYGHPRSGSRDTTCILRPLVVLPAEGNVPYLEGMNLLQIAWRNFCHRPLSSFLTTLSLTLGVALVVLVISIYGVVREAFTNNASFGYNLVIGPPGSDLQITLNSVYYLSQPVENLPYEYYMRFLTQDQRARQVEAYGGDPSLAEEPGQFASAVAEGYAIPLALGDYFGKFRLVGTTPEFFEKLKFGPELQRELTFREGRAFVTRSDENGYFEAVLGNRVAKEMGVAVGETIYPAHGDPEGKSHAEGFKVVGILAASGTPQDRAAFVNLEGFYLMEGHSQDVAPEELEASAVQPVGAANQKARDEDRYEDLQPLTIPEREVTAILVKTGFIFGPGLQSFIQEEKLARAATPVAEIAKLMELIVDPVSQALLAITLITCVVAAVGVLVAIYNSMNDRRRDIAVMRALGARRETVTTIIIVESFIIAIIGSFVGWIVAHALIASQSERIEDSVGVATNFWTSSSAELYIIPVVAALALVAALLPALAAYRTDVSSNLSP